MIQSISTGAPPVDTSEQPVLQLRNLTATFSNGNGGLKVLDDVSFSVYDQEFLCVLGPSGSGKSTLLRLIAGLIQPTHGDLIFAKGQRPRIGYVFQSANLMPWRTVMQNITLPLELEDLSPVKAQAKAEELIELVGLQGFEKEYPRNLSGGMAQRVSLARALIFDPEVLLLDEPFGALDAMTREHMGEELLHIWQVRRKTVIMVTHSIAEAVFLADRVIVLTQRPGKVCLDLPVTLPRPRAEEVRYTPRFGELAHRLRTAIG